jgi:hypothetical protein
MAFVVLATTLTHAAKIYSQCHETRVVQGTGGTKDYFVMHGSAAERMRMKYQGDASRRHPARLFENCFEPTMWNWNEEIADWVHWKFNLPNRPDRVHAMKAVVNIVPT